MISIIGSSGSGKSSFLRCINLPGQPHARQILRAAADKQLQRLRSRLSMVSQHFNLWAPMNVLENLMEAPAHVLGVSKAEARAKAEHYLQKGGVVHRKAAYPAQMSGGARVAIARALSMEPEVMLFDEPTSALDPELVGDALKVMRDLADEGRTMAVVTHEMGFAGEVSNGLLFLHQGLLEEQGDPREVLANPHSQRLQQFLGGSRT